MKRFCVVIVALLAFVGCGGGDDGGAELEGRSFSTTEIEGHELVEGSTLKVTFDEGRIVVSAGCNGMSADYEVVEERLKLTSALVSTMMGCEQDLIDQDEWLADFFSAEPRLSEPSEETLTFEGDGVTITLDETAS